MREPTYRSADLPCVYGDSGHCLLQEILLRKERGRQVRISTLTASRYGGRREFYRLRKNPGSSSLVSGHDFSRVVRVTKNAGL